MIHHDFLPFQFLHRLQHFLQTSVHYLFFQHFSMFHHNFLIMSYLFSISLMILLMIHFHYLVFELYFLILSSFLQNFVIYSSSLHLTFITCGSTEPSFIVNTILSFSARSLVLVTILSCLFTIV